MLGPQRSESRRSGIPGPASVPYSCQLLAKYLSALLLTKCPKLEKRESKKTQTDMVLCVGRTSTQTNPRCMDRNAQKTGVWLCLCIIKISWQPFNSQKPIEVYMQPQLSCLRKEWVLDLDILVTSADFLPHPTPHPIVTFSIADFMWNETSWTLLSKAGAICCDNS